MKPRTSLVAILAVVAGTAAGESKLVPGAVAVNTAISVRQAGMGELSYGDDASRGWTNPAALALVESRGEVAISGGSQFGLQTLTRLAGAWGVTPGLMVGGYLSNMSVGFDRYNMLADKDGTLEYGLMGLGLGGGWRWKWLGLGLNARMLSESFKDGETISNTGFGVDLGAVARYRGFCGGVSARNIGPSIVGDDESMVGESMPAEIRASLGYNHEPLNLNGGLELIMPPGADMGLGLGVEWWPVKVFALRGGMVGSMGTGGATPSFTFGLSGKWNGICLDYALNTHAIGMTNVVALAYQFGPGERTYVEPVPAPRKEPAPEPAKEPEPKPEPVAAAPARPAGQKLNVAIADLSAQGVSASDAAVMADLLRSEMVKTGQFNVIEKQNMDKVLAEHAFQQTGCTSEECAVKLGKLLNVQRMVVGSFGKLLDSYFLNVRVVDVETGAVVFGDSVEGSKVSDLKVGVKDLAAKLARQIR